MNFLKTLAILFASTGFAAAKAPKPPSNFTVKPLGVNSFLLEWQDNSKNEKGWDIRVSLGDTSSPKHFLFLPNPNLTSYVVLTQNLSGKTLSFQLAAYNGNTGSEKISKPTKAVSVTALEGATFGNPLDLTAKPMDDGRIRIAWKDKSTTEEGYQIEYRKGSDKWAVFATINPGVNFSIPASGFEPDTSYSFRVRAFKQFPAIFTKYSNVATAKTLPFRAPGDLTAMAEADGAISLKWKDRSSREDGYEIETKTGTAAFSKLGEVGPNVVSTNAITGFSFNTDVQVRVRGFRTVSSARVYTDYSNVVTVKTTNLAAPEGFAAQVLDDTSVKLTWKDASARETGYQVEYRETGAANYNDPVSLAANAKEHTLTGLSPHKSYDVRVRSYQGFPPFFGSYSAYTPVVVATTKDGFTGDLNPPIFWNTSFLHTISVSRTSELSSLTVTGSLPSGIVFNSTNRTISGTTTFDGYKTVSLKAVFKDGWTTTRPFTLRVIRQPSAPLAGTAFGPVQVAVGSTSSASLTGKFSDPDTAEARRLVTTKGNVDIILYPSATPITVDNFLDYADGGRYAGTFFHRSPDNFVVQGGGYSHNGSAFSKVQTFAAIKNEPGISNVAGTVAMAKIGGQPDSATSEFFVSIGDNSANLDAQNEGFTVFGRVAGAGMTVMNAINDLPRKNYTVTVGTTSTTLEDVPMDAATAPASMDPSKLVKITSVSTPPILSYEATSVDSGIATAVVNGNNVDITGVATGSTTIHVKATDLDGQSVTQDIAVTVP